MPTRPQVPINLGPRIVMAGGFRAISGGGGAPSFELENGTAAAPALTFVSDTDTGVYRIGANNVGFSAGGTLQFDYNTTRILSAVPIYLPNGSAAAPSVAIGEPATGFFSPGAGTVRFATGTASIIVFSSAGIQIIPSTGVLSFGSPSDVLLKRGGAGVLRLENGTNAQRLDLANTYTSSTNNELFSVDWQTLANNVYLGTRTATTGTSRPVWVVAQTDNAGNNAAFARVARTTAPFFSTGLANVSTGGVDDGTTLAGNFNQFARITSTATSGSIAAVAITPTYNQASGTAANTDLLINRTETAIGSGQQNLIDAQVGGSSRYRVDRTGGQFIGGANGQSFNSIQSLTELTTVAAAATTDTTIQMPANSVVLGVSVRVTTVIPTATSFSVGDSGSATRFSTTNVGVAADSTDPGTKAGAYYNASALSIRLTMNGGTPAANTGRVRVTIYYYTITPPTS